MRIPLSVAALLLLLAWTTQAAEEREETAAPTSEERSSGRNFLIGAAVLAAGVVATTVGLSRKRKIKVIRKGSTVVERLDELPSRPPESDDAGRGDVG